MRSVLKFFSLTYVVSWIFFGAAAAISGWIAAPTSGLAAIRGKNEWWYSHNEVHSGKADGPFVNGDRFAVGFEFDVTARDGERAGQRNTFREVALYTVKDGKIVREEFYY